MDKPTTKAAKHISQSKDSRLFVVPKNIIARLKRKARKASSTQLLKGPYAITRLIFTGTLIVAITLFALLLISYFVIQNTYILPRVVWSAIALLYILLILIPIKRKSYVAASWMIISLYASVATFVLIFWGISTPIGVLLMGFSVVLAGVMLGASYIIPVTIVTVFLMILAQSTTSTGIIVPDRSSFIVSGNFGDVAAYSIVLAVFALLSWLSRRQLEQALNKALKAEKALKREKSLLAIRLDQQTKKLRDAQLQEMKQLYHFAEIGQLSTSILHELANYLSVLTMDIDDLDQRHKDSKSIQRAKSSITDLERMISKARLQVHTTNSNEKLNLVNVVPEIISSLTQKAHKAKVSIKYSAPDRKSFTVNGDSLRLSQVITVLVTNSIDAYKETYPHKNRQVIYVSLTANHDHAVISIRDYGPGIPRRKRDGLFSPHQSKKKHGMGIGLFITKEMVETHFKGQIEIDPSSEYTQFNIILPKSIKDKSSEKPEHKILKGVNRSPRSYS